MTCPRSSRPVAPGIVDHQDNSQGNESDSQEEQSHFWMVSKPSHRDSEEKDGDADDEGCQ